VKLRDLSGLDPRIQEVIEAFRPIAPSRAFDACKETSAQFTEFAQEYHLDARWFQLGGGPADLKPEGRWADIPRQHWIHYVTKIDTAYVDWTASQFGDGDSVPSISIHGSGWDKEYDVTDALDEYLSGIDEELAESLMESLKGIHIYELPSLLRTEMSIEGIPITGFKDYEIDAFWFDQFRYMVINGGPDFPNMALLYKVPKTALQGIGNREVSVGKSEIEGYFLSQITNPDADTVLRLAIDDADRCCP
jgi:hypothetical protein